jgi:DNA polymerase-3 subunit alpha
MTLDKSNTDKLAEFRNESSRLGIKVEPPSINFSGVDFEVHRDSEGALTIRYALSAIKGVGEGQAKALVNARGTKPFRDLSELATRLNPREVNKKVLEALAAAGAFDELERDRAKAFAAVEPILGLANRAQDDHLAGQSGLFGAGEPEALRLSHYENWSAEERLRREFEAIGFFISGHPLDAYQKVLERLKVMSWAPFVRSVKQGAVANRLAATVLDRAERRTKSGNKMGIVTLSDPTGQYEAILFQEGLNQYRDLLEKGACVLVTLQANLEGEDVRARITMVEKLDEAAARIQKGLRIILRDVAPLPKLSEKLKGKPEGDVILVLRLDAPEREVEIKLPGRYPINPQASSAIKAIPGVAEVELV